MKERKEGVQEGERRWRIKKGRRLRIVRLI